MRSDFGYNGKNTAAKEFVETVNWLVQQIEGMSIDFGANGGTDIATFNHADKGLKIDLSQLYIPPPPPP